MLSVAALIGSAVVLSIALLGTVGGANHAVFTVTITNATSPAMPISPGAFLVHTEPNEFWTVGGRASAALEAIAEDGDPSVAVEAGLTQIGTAGLGFDESFVFQFEADEGDHLSTANMLVLTNDAFVGVYNLPLFSADGTAISRTIQLEAYDAGTERNEPIGSGIGQPEGDGPGTGNRAFGTVRLHGQFRGSQATLHITHGVVTDTDDLPVGGSGGLANDFGGSTNLSTLSMVGIAAAAVLAAGALAVPMIAVRRRS